MTRRWGRERTALLVAGMVLSVAACSGKSTSGQESESSAGRGGSAGSGLGGDAAGGSGGNAATGAASGVGASGAGAAAGGTGGGGSGGATAGGGTVDGNGNCPAGLDYFMTVEGDLPSRRLTESCAEHMMDASVPVYDLGQSLDASMQRFQAFIGCNGDERLDVWLLGYPNEDSAGGFYTSPDGVTDTVCGTTSRRVSATTDCAAKAGTVTYAPSASAPEVVEGSYAMNVYDDAGKAYAIHGDFRVCAYFLR